MDEDVARAVDMVAGDASVATSHGTVVRLTTAEAAPAGAEIIIPFPGGGLAYVPMEPAPTDPVTVSPDVKLAGNAFLPVHESARCRAAVINLSATRSVTMGPESARIVIPVRGSGLVFLDNGDNLNVKPGVITILPAGESARAWSRGPDDLLMVVLQPGDDAPAERRTLASEIARRKAAHDAPTNGAERS